MNQEHKTLLEVDVVNGSLGASEGARRATGGAPSEAEPLPDPATPR
jgi:hypothetical protein